MNEAGSGQAPLTKTQTLVMMVSVFVVALCGIAYELIIAGVSTYLLGNSIYQFSITIGLFMFAMGIGSYVSKWITTHLVTRFIVIEIVVALIGGISSSLLFLIFPFVVLYQPVMYGLILIIGTLVGLEIPLLTQILSRAATWRESIANVLSVDYLGALVGSVALPILLLPSLGLFRASYAIGLLNAAVALVAVSVFGRTLWGYRKCLLGAISVVVALLIGLGTSTHITRFAEGQLFADGIIYRQQTPYQRIVITKNEMNDEIRMYLDGHLQFASRDEYRYHEALVHPVMSAPGPRSRVLILGGGDGLAVREVLKFQDVEQIDLVDIDPTVVQLSRTMAPLKAINQNALESSKLNYIAGDAYRYMIDYSFQLTRGEVTPYDRVIIDLPDPHNETLDKLYSKEFYQIVRSCVSPNGYLVCQSSSPLVMSEVYWCIGKTIEAADWDVYSYHIPLNSFGVWGFHLARRDQPLPDSIEINPETTRFLTSETLLAAGTFPQDMQAGDIPVNRTFEPQLYTLYEKAIHK